MAARTATASTKRTRTATSRSASPQREPQERDDSYVITVDGFGNLTEKQRRFCLAYRSHGNGTRAAIEASYQVCERENAGDIARVLLRNPKVLAYLAFLARDDDVTDRDVTAHLMREGLAADHAGARVRALELVGKSRGMFADDVNLRISTAPDQELARTIAGDDNELFEKILARLRGE